MSRAEDYLHAVAGQTSADQRFGEAWRVVTDLLLAVADAWVEVDAGFTSEAEANRWSPVCSAAERVVLG